MRVSAALAVLAAVAFLSTAAQARQAERPCTIRGTPGPDALLGTSGDDVICGFGGDDIISGVFGDDVVRGGPGIDKLYGGPGDDFLNARDGAGDYVNGGLGFDWASRESIDRLVSIER